MPSRRKGQVVAVDHARRVDLAADQRARRVAFAADVVAVQTHADVEAADREVPSGLQARRSQMCASGSSVAWGESTAPTPTVLPRRSASVWIGLSARTTIDRRQVTVGVAHAPGQSTSRPLASARRRARTQASGEFQATWMRPSSRSVTWRS